MITPFVEEDCTIQHEGHTFESGGAYVVGDQAVAYLGKDDVLTDWHGTRIGSFRVVSSWRNARGWFPSLTYAVRAYIKGKVYCGRGPGEGMAINLRRCALNQGDPYGIE